MTSYKFGDVVLVPFPFSNLREQPPTWMSISPGA